MADDILEHELNEWLKTLFFALEPANVSLDEKTDLPL